MKLDSMGRPIYPRTKEWTERIGNALRKGRDKVCPCGKTFFVHLYRFEGTKYCSNKCFGEYHNFIGYNKGKKIPKGAVAKLGAKNPMFGYIYTEAQKEKKREVMIAYYDKKGRVSKEHKRRIKTELENARWNSKRANGGSHTRHEWDDVKKKQDYTCLHCKKREPEIKLTKDHIIPISRGGRSDIANIQGLCLRCNISKKDKI